MGGRCKDPLEDGLLELIEYREGDGAGASLRFPIAVIIENENIKFAK